MKRIKAACLYQTIHFQLKDGISAEFNRRQARQEYENYKAHLNQSRTQYRIMEEEQPDGSLIVKIRKQNNSQPVGDYLE